MLVVAAPRECAASLPLLIVLQLFFECAQVGIGGSTKIGKWCLFGGQAAAPDHLTIGDRVMVAARGALHRDTPDGAIIAGCPAVALGLWRR